MRSPARARTRMRIGGDIMCDKKKSAAVKKRGAVVANRGHAAGAARVSGGARATAAGKRKVVSPAADAREGAGVEKVSPVSGARAALENVADKQATGVGGGASEGAASNAAAGAAPARGAAAARAGAGKREKVERRHRAEFEGMLGRHVDNSLWLRSRAPLLMALSDLAMFEDSSDSVRFRAMEKVEELLEKAEDEKRRETTGNMSEGLEASVRRLESALRRGARDRDY